MENGKKKRGRPPKKALARSARGRWGKEKAPAGHEGSEDGGGAAEAEGASPSQRVLAEECDSCESLTPSTPELPSTSDGLLGACGLRLANSSAADEFGAPDAAIACAILVEHYFWPSKKTETSRKCFRQA